MHACTPAVRYSFVHCFYGEVWVHVVYALWRRHGYIVVCSFVGYIAFISHQVGIDATREERNKVSAHVYEANPLVMDVTIVYSHIDNRCIHSYKHIICLSDSD